MDRKHGCDMGWNGSEWDGMGARARLRDCEIDRQDDGVRQGFHLLGLCLHGNLLLSVRKKAGMAKKKSKKADRE